MLAQYQVELVRKMLAVGLISRRQIARATGVSRSVIAQIAARKRADLSATNRVYLEMFLRPPRRCPTCGCWSHPPCRSCHTREFIHKYYDGPRRPSGKYRVIVGVDLKPRHFARYQEVRAARRAKEAVDSRQ